MRKKTRLHGAVGLAVLMALAGCGGGGGQTGSPISGKLMDGYIKGGLVCLDTNSNLRCDAGEPSTITGSAGQFTLHPVKNTSLAGLFLVAEIGSTAEDLDVPGQPMAETRMLGLAEKPAVVSPLTTVVASMVHAGDNLSQAESRARTLLALSPTFDFSTDYIATGDRDIHALAQAVNIVGTTVVGNATINTAQFLDVVTKVKEDLRSSGAELRAALASLFDKDDVLVGDFDGTKPSFGAIGGADASLAAAPTGGNGDALRVVRVAGSEAFAGVGVDLETAISGAQFYTVTARVNVEQQAAGKPVKLKLESSSAQSAELESREAVVSGWQTLTWIFNTSPNDTYSKLIVLPNVGTAGNGETYYLDDIKLSKGKVLANFDTVVPSWFGNNGSAVVTSEAEPEGGTGHAMKVVKNPSDTWAGAAINLDQTITGATSYTFTARVYSPADGRPMVLKLVNLNDDTQSVQATSKQAVVAGWQSLTWEFTGAQDWWYLNKLYFQPNDGVAGAGEAYYLDDIVMK